MPTDDPNSNVTILRPGEGNREGKILTRGQSSMRNRVRYAKMELVSVLMKLDDLGVDVSRIDLRVVLEFGRRFNNL